MPQARALRSAPPPVPQHIARECGILTEGGLALEGPDFRRMAEEELLPLLPKLQVGWVAGVGR